MKIQDEILNVQLTVNFSGYGHYKVSGLVYGKPFYYTESDMTVIDDFKDDNERKSNSGARILINRLRKKYKAQI